MYAATGVRNVSVAEEIYLTMNASVDAAQIQPSRAERLRLQKVLVRTHFLRGGTEAQQPWVYEEDGSRLPLMLAAFDQAGWRRRFGTPWEPCLWMLDSAEDRAFRTEYWERTRGTLYDDDEDPDTDDDSPALPTQRDHLLPAGTTHVAATTAQLLRAIESVPRRAAVRGGVHIALTELLTRKLLDAEVAKGGLDGWVAAAGTALHTLWRASASAVVEEQGTAGVREAAELSLAQRKRLYEAEVVAISGVTADTGKNPSRPGGGHGRAGRKRRRERGGE
jgi:hypothetical protein